MNTYKTYDLFLFDMDGTLVNTEYLHYKAYLHSFLHFDIPINISYEQYCSYAHFDDIKMKDYIAEHTIIPYSKIYSEKKNKFLDMIDNDLRMIDGAENLLNELFKNNVKICIVSHSDRTIIDKILEKIPLLKEVDYIFTRDDYTHRKPHPECYLKALQKFPNCKNPIGFEDSYKGYVSLNQTNITPVFIGNEKYYYFKKLNPLNHFENFSLINWSNLIEKKNDSNVFINSCIDKYLLSLQECKYKFVNIMNHILPLIKSTNGKIYLTGVGKCGHICRKSVSTWQSLGIQCYNLSIVDLFHGDFGILNTSNNNDIILYISNSGNTDELINCCKYVRSRFNILQVCITINSICKVSDVVDFHYSLIKDENKINEIDSINMAPTTSSVIFMSLLDMIGVKLSEDRGITIDKFKLTHPGGDLGLFSSNIIDYVVITASGHSKRLQPLTNYIPKVLLSWNGKPFIQHLVEYWNNYSKNIIIICLSQHKSLIDFYTKDYNNISFICPQNNDDFGTADRLNNVLSNEYYGKNILITWCDIIPKGMININKLEKSTIFTFGSECRYGIQLKDNKNKIIKQSNGNIIGMYYIKSYFGINKYTIGDDICDVFLQNFGDFDSYDLNDIGLIDIGDMPKFKLAVNFQNNKFITRFFNKITTTNNNTLLKTSISKQGDNIIENEILWYKFINNKFNMTPIIFNYGNNYLEMECINADPLYKHFKYLNDNEKINIIHNIIKKLQILHNVKPSKIISDNVILNDIYFESYEKVIQRVNVIKPIIEYFGKINKVNDYHIFPLETILTKCMKIITEHSKKTYTLIHGDCQFSNILYNPKNNNLYLIDPRGYFGHTKIFGLQEYDFAKLLYALSGYDEFNTNNEYFIKLINENTNEMIISIDNYEHLFSILPSDIFNHVTIAFLVIIWISYSQYIVNDCLKCISAYYYGHYLFSKYINNKY